MANLPSIVDTIRDEPIRLVAAVMATLSALVLFGVPLTAEQLAGIEIAIAAWLALVTRNRVTPLG